MENTDEEIKRVWANANFGPEGDTAEGRLRLIVNALSKSARGYDLGGHTMSQICTELGLVKLRRGSRIKYDLTDLGLYWLIACTIQ